MEYTTVNTYFLTTHLKTNSTKYILFQVPLYLFSPLHTKESLFQALLQYIKNHYLFENFKNYQFHSYKIPETNWCN